MLLFLYDWDIQKQIVLHEYIYKKNDLVDDSMQEPGINLNTSMTFSLAGQ